ncbi:MAG TPA: CHASE2 domain-containing protein, partial [Armatimonadetes bacterium]|nr:CHASE2 domain-containing protein [Armatimonadota bacterium]
MGMHQLKLMREDEHSGGVTIYQRYARVSMLIGIITAIAFCTLYLLHIFPIPQLEDWLIRQWFSMRGERHAPPDIVIITIDNESLRRLGRWPWRRYVHAKLLRRLRQAQVVLMDILFIEREREHPNDDVELRTAMLEAGNVLLPILRMDEVRAPVDEERRALAKMRMFAYPFGDAPHSVTLPISALRAPMASLMDACAGVGIAYSRPDSIGIYRRIPLGVLVSHERWRGKDTKVVIYPSVVLEAVRIALGLGRANIQFADASVQLGNIMTVRTPAGATSGWLMDINFAGGRHAFSQYPYYLVHDGRIPPSEFRNKVVLVGFTAQGLYDIRPSPFDPLTYGVEILANAIYTLLHRQAFTYIPPGVVLILVLAVGLASGWILPRVNPLLAFLLFVFMLVGITFIALKLFSINVMFPASPLYL